MLHIRRTLIASAAILALALAGCGAAPDGEGPGNGPGTNGEVVDTIVVTGDTEEQVYFLRGGRYRVGWSHRCPSIGVALRQVDGPYEHVREARSPAFNAIVSNVPAGAFTYEQTNPECEQFEIRIDRVGN